MDDRVAIVGVGVVGATPSSPQLSYKELMFEAASMAYEDAGINPRQDVQSFVSCSEDFLEGTSIFDEYVPDQLGAVLKPVCTISADGAYGVINAYMQILTGLFDVVAVEAHSKISDVRNPDAVMELALDPVFTRPLGVNPSFVAGMEMKRYLHDSKATEEQCAEVVVKNKRNAMSNPRAAYPGMIDVADVMHSDISWAPLKRLDESCLADGAAVLVLASGDRAKHLTENPVWILGAGWATETPWLETRSWGEATYAAVGAKRAYKQANIEAPNKTVDLAEIDDAYSYKELQHLEALSLCEKNSAGRLASSGHFARDGPLPVNSSGGSLGCGHTLEMSGLHRMAEAALQLRGHGASTQVKDAKVAVVQSWRGVPTTSGAVLVLGNSEVA